MLTLICEDILLQEDHLIIIAALEYYLVER